MAIYYSSLFESVNTQGTSAGLFTTTTASNYAGPVPTKKGEVIHVRGSVVVSANLTTADKVRFFWAPKGTRLASWNAEWGDLDTATTLVANVGWEASDPDAALAASAIFQAADTTAAGNGLTEDATETVFDQVATTADDFFSLVPTVNATGLAAAVTITFKASFYAV